MTNSRLMITAHCVHCGRAFETLKHKARKCCSDECFRASVGKRARERKSLRTDTCQACGKTFEQDRKKHKKSCSPECDRAVRSKNVGDAIRKGYADGSRTTLPAYVTVNCQQCGQPFDTRRLCQRRFCSVPCRKTHRNATFSTTMKEVWADPERSEKLRASAAVIFKRLWTDETFREMASRASSERMTRRRNGGDPELNAILAKASGDHLRRLWQKPEYREKARERSSKHIIAYMASDARLDRDANHRRIMGRASRRLRDSTDWCSLMSAKTSEYMAQEPYRPTEHGDYIQEYCSMIMTRIAEDPEVRKYHDGWMSIFLKEEYEAYRQTKLRNTLAAAPPHPDQPHTTEA